MAISVVCTSGIGTPNPGGLTLTLSTASTGILSGDNIIVACCGRNPSPNFTVLSGSGAAYTQIVPNISTPTPVTYNFAVFRRVASAGELTVTCDGATPMVGVYSVFRSPTANLSVGQNSAASTTADPDSPVVSVPSSNCAVISIYGIPDGSVTATPTSPLAFNLLFDVVEGPVFVESAMSWVTYPSAAPIDPGPWIASPSVSQWSAATIVLGSTDFLPRTIPTVFSVREFLPYRRRVRMVGY